MLGFTPTTSLAGRGEKQCETHELLSRAGGCVGSTYFSGAVDIGIGFTLSSAGSAPDHEKYPVDDINEPTPCTLLYVKGRMLWTIEIVALL
jgi:hypothetical protein